MSVIDVDSEIPLPSYEGGRISISLLNNQVGFQAGAIISGMVNLHI